MGAVGWDCSKWKTLASPTSPPSSLSPELFQPAPDLQEQLPFQKQVLNPGSGAWAVGWGSLTALHSLLFQLHIHLQPQGEPQRLRRRGLLPVCGELPGHLRRLLRHGVRVCCRHGPDILCLRAGAGDRAARSVSLGCFWKGTLSRPGNGWSGSGMTQCPWATGISLQAEGPRLRPCPGPVLARLTLCS